jgi:hypothetical protein
MCHESLHAQLMVPTSHLPPAASTVSSLCIYSYFYISAACISYKWILAQISRPKAANHAQPPGESTGAQEYEIPFLFIYSYIRLNSNINNETYLRSLNLWFFLKDIQMLASYSTEAQILWNSSPPRHQPLDGGVTYVVRWAAKHELLFTNGLTWKFVVHSHIR